MKTLEICKDLAMVSFLIAASCSTNSRQNEPCRETGNEHYSAVEIDGVLCGYSVNSDNTKDKSLILCILPGNLSLSR